MLVEVLSWLRTEGIEAERLDERSPGHSDGGFDTVVGVRAGGVEARFAAEEKQRAPYPNELTRLSAQRPALGRLGRPLLIVPFVSEALGRALIEAGWSWADTQGNFDLRAPGLVLRQRRTTTAPKPRRTKLPQGSGSLAIVRALIRLGDGKREESGATALAVQAKVSQPRASQVLSQLHALGLVEKSREGRWIPRRETLLDRFLADYRGPGGSEQYLYSLDPPTEVAVRSARLRTSRRPIVVSADVGPDLILAWRRPTTLVLYATHEIDTDALGVVEAHGSHDANVVLRIPRDRSVFPAPELVVEVQDVEIPLADPSQLIWDLENLGGADRLEAAGMLREWLLTRP